MSTIRKSIETVYAAATFAERNLPQEAKALLQEQPQTVKAQVRPSTQAVKRSRPTLQAK